MDNFKKQLEKQLGFEINSYKIVPKLRKVSFYFKFKAADNGRTGYVYSKKGNRNSTGNG